jgi:hypothetical protein
MEQYTFNVNQEVWSRYTGLTTGAKTGLRIAYEPSADTADDNSPPNDGQEPENGGIRTENYKVPGRQEIGKLKYIPHLAHLET